MKSFLAVLAALTLAGCSTPTKMAETPSGRPEIIIATNDVAGIKALILDDMLNHGYLVEQDTAYSLVLVRQIKGGGEGFLAGLTMGASGSGAGQTKRVTVYNFTPAAGGGTRVVVSSQWQKHSYGQTSSQELAMDGATFNTFYTQLQQIKQRVEKPVAAR